MLFFIFVILGLLYRDFLLMGLVGILVIRFNLRLFIGFDFF